MMCRQAHMYGVRRPPRHVLGKTQHAETPYVALRHAIEGRWTGLLEDVGPLIDNMQYQGIGLLDLEVHYWGGARRPLGHSDHARVARNDFGRFWHPLGTQTDAYVMFPTDIHTMTVIDRSVTLCQGYSS